MTNKFKLIVFDFDDTLILHNAFPRYRKEYEKTLTVNIQQLFEMGKILVIASNSIMPETLRTTLEELNILHLFTKLLIGRNKESMLKELMKDFSVAPQEVVFIDDQMHNIDIGRRLGIKSINVSRIQGIMQRTWEYLLSN